jgi:hypothetical protein
MIIDKEQKKFSHSAPPSRTVSKPKPAPDRPSVCPNAIHSGNDHIGPIMKTFLQ